MKKTLKYYSLILLSFFFVHLISAQDKEDLILLDLLKMAETNYPLLKAKSTEVLAARESVNVGASTRIPSLEASYQLNYGTHNNITGMNYPQFLIPISGPPSVENLYAGIFGSAASLLFSWQPITFGQRQSQIDYAKAGLQYAKADEGNEIFRHKIKVIQAYLDILATTELVKVFEENLKRAEAALLIVKTLVVNGIKPGVDTALLKSEMSKAKVELLNSKKNRQQAGIILSQLLATDEFEIVSDTGYFHKLPEIVGKSDSLNNPLLALYNSNIELSKARKKVLNKTTMPTLGVWGTTYARGSGIDYNGKINSIEGLGFQRFNYGLGAQLSVPLLQSFRVNPQLKQQDFLIQANAEKFNELTLQLKKQNDMADAALQNAMAVAQESPLFYESANYSYRALLSRYQSGLANFADLVQAQYGLVKAEVERKTSYIEVWKSLLFKAAVNGDLNLFMNQIK